MIPARRHLLDLSPLRLDPAFRRLWANTSLSFLGWSIGSFALAFWVWDQTHDALLVALVALVQFVPRVLVLVPAGRLIDRVERRRLLLLLRIAQLVSTLGLAGAVSGGIALLPLVLVLMGILAGLDAVASPAAKAVLPRVLGPGRLGAGIALQTVSTQAVLLLGPMLGGFAILGFGVAGCVLVDALSFAGAISGAARLPSLPPERAEAHDRDDALEGLRYLARTPVLAGAVISDVAATVLAFPVALFPIINSELFAGSPLTLAFFGPALAIGGVLGGALSGRFSAAPHPGRTMLGAVFVWGVALAGFAFVPSTPLPLAVAAPVALVLLAVAGSADALSVVSRSIIVAAATPDRLRGRVAVVDHLVGVGGPLLGNLRAGLVAAASSGLAAAAIGGAMAAVAAVGLWAGAPGLRTWRNPDAAPAAVADAAGPDAADPTGA